MDLGVAGGWAHARHLGFYAVPGESDGDTGTGPAPWDVPSEHTQPGRARTRLADTWLLGKFHERFPGLYYKWGHGWSITNDGTIPHRLFLLMLECVESIEAGEELRMAHAVCGGYLRATSEDKKIGHAFKNMAKRAFPERLA